MATAPLDVRLYGAGELRRMAMRLREAARTKWRQRIVAGVREGVAPLEAAVKAEAAATLPSGYAGTMAAAVEVKTRVQLGANVGVEVRVQAKGKAEHRDVNTIDKGALRHPLPSGRTKWYTTRVPRGFASRPWERLKPDIVDSIDRNMSALSEELERG